MRICKGVLGWLFEADFTSIGRQKIWQARGYLATDLAEAIAPVGFPVAAVAAVAEAAKTRQMVKRAVAENIRR
jgi:hypothetical protein